jgi:hypothetical protein
MVYPYDLTPAGVVIFDLTDGFVNNDQALPEGDG